MYTSCVASKLNAHCQTAMPCLVTANKLMRMATAQARWLNNKWWVRLVVSALVNRSEETTNKRVEYSTAWSVLILDLSGQV